MLTWIAVVIVFGILILIHEAGHLIAAKKAGIKVEAFSIGMGKRVFGKKIGDTDYRISLIPFGGFCQMSGEDPAEANGAEYEFSSKPVGSRFWVIAAGSLTNYVFAFILFCVIFMMGVPTLSNRVGEVMKDYPAVKAGIKEGDRILSVNGRKVGFWEDIVDEIQSYSPEEGSIDIEISRPQVNNETELLTLKIEPDISVQTNIFGQTISRPVIGIRPSNEILAVSYSPLEAVYQGGKRLLALTGMTYKGIWLLITGGMPVKSSVSGPIGIARIIEQAAGLGIVPLLIVTAHVSMALAVFNLLPFPVLDGGHIIFLLIEKLRGRPMNIKVQEVITQVALFALIAFALFISWQDILKITPLGK